MPGKRENLCTTVESSRLGEGRCQWFNLQRARSIIGLFGIRWMLIFQCLPLDDQVIHQMKAVRLLMKTISAVAPSCQWQRLSPPVGRFESGEMLF